VIFLNRRPAARHHRFSVQVYLTEEDLSFAEVVYNSEPVRLNVKALLLFLNCCVKIHVIVIPSLCSLSDSMVVVHLVVLHRAMNGLSIRPGKNDPRMTLRDLIEQSKLLIQLVSSLYLMHSER